MLTLRQQNGRVLPSGAGQRLRRLGQQFEEWGGLDAVEFDEVVRKQAWQTAAGVLSAPVKSGIPAAQEAFYARFREKYADILRERLIAGDYLTPTDLRHVGSAEEIGRVTREIVQRFGELLQAWPEIYAAAARLRARGVELAPHMTAD